MFVANALALRLTRFTPPRFTMPCQIFHRRPGGKLCVGRSASHASLRTEKRTPSTLYERYPIRHDNLHTVCHLGGTYHSLPLALVLVFEVGEAVIRSVGNEREQKCCRVKRKTLWGPSGKKNCWRCEPLSFAYFSLRRQRKVGAAPHRGDA